MARPAAASALLASFLLIAAPAAGQELPEGQGPAEYAEWLASSPGVRAQVLSYESWQQAAGVDGVLPTYQLLRTASMWRECGGEPFEVPPHQFWPDMVRTLRYIRDHVRPALGPVEAVSGYRNPALNQCARGSARSAHLDYFALDLIPLVPIDRRSLFERLCAVHARHGPGAEAGLGFYSFLRFHVDTRGFRRCGAAGPQGNESPCAVIERGGDPMAPPLTVTPAPTPVTAPAPAATPPGTVETPSVEAPPPPPPPPRPAA